MDVKFGTPIQDRMQDVSLKVYKQTMSDFTREIALLEYMYAALRIGFTSLDQNQQSNSNKLAQIMKRYALEKEEGIDKIFEKGCLESIIQPIRGNSHEHEEIKEIFFFLLKENESIFLQNEIAMAKGNGGPIASEYVAHSIVKTMCGQPPIKISLFDLKIKNCNIDFQKMDHSLLLDLAYTALDLYIKNNR